MDRENFKLLIDCYTKIRDDAIDLCRLDLSEFKLKDYNAEIARARSIQGKMDAFHMDLYRIIEIGNLTAAQQSTLCKLVREIGMYRTDVKRIASKVQVDLVKSLKKDSYNTLAGVQLIGKRSIGQ